MRTKSNGSVEFYCGKKIGDGFNGTYSYNYYCGGESRDPDGMPPNQCSECWDEEKAWHAAGGFNRKSKPRIKVKVKDENKSS